MNPFPFEPAPEHSTDDVPRLAPYTCTRGGRPATYTTVCPWTQGYVALDTETRGIFIVAASRPDE